MDKSRLELCRSFTNSKTIAQQRKDDEEAYWTRKREIQEMHSKAQRLIRAINYANRPWYKKIFD